MKDDGFIRFLTAKKWWPFWGGVAFGLVEVLSFLIADSPLGASKPFVEVCSIATFIASDKWGIEYANVLLDNYFSSYLPQISWGTTLLVGVILGGFLSSILSKDFKIKAVPPMWEEFYGPSRSKRFFWVFIGGIFVALGGRFGQGCISGQLISGVVQLGVGGFIFMFSVWIGGLITAFVFYRGNFFNITR
jgi:hypothetical protein